MLCRYVSIYIVNTTRSTCYIIHGQGVMSDNDRVQSATQLQMRPLTARQRSFRAGALATCCTSKFSAFRHGLRHKEFRY